MEYAIQLKNVTKTFGKVIANKDVSLDIRKGEILSLLGENGSGKTTLMNMIAGIYYPDSGEILVEGKPVEIRSPKDAYDLGIGMIHQHFKLIDVFTACENIALGLDKSEKFEMKAIQAKAKAICDKYHFDLNLNQKVYEMSVSQKQTLEIVKALYRGANILILDEPTAVLTPQETERLFDVIRNMRADNKSVIIITHKLHEVLEISDRVAILRKGEYVGTVDTKDATESSLTEMMVGKKVTLNIKRSDPVNPVKRLAVRNLTVYNRENVKVLNNVSFDAYGGEILGIAGISGNGQKELLESVAGLQTTAEGSSIKFFEKGKEDKPLELVGMNPRQIRDAGVHLAFVPEDRLGMGLVGSMGMTGNMLLKSYGKGHSPLTDMKAPKSLAEKVRDDLEVVTPSINTPVSRLSGGNVQKVLVGREIAERPTVLMTAYAVRGLDINTSYTIYNLLNEEKESGSAVVYVGEDLDVLIDLCDRILVLCDGQANGILDARNTTKEEVGLLMTNLKKGGAVNE
ncbi:MAG: ABC transporter ATP-binding protein [Clostridia bacterium]|nr:ABC transporter ATP-binding protein [Clostridia bacterium]MDY5556103.1 ABC transporter ATP-binding protein [Blautia sp.]